MCLTIIQIYAPTTGAEATIIEKFYADLQQLSVDVSTEDAILIISHRNEKVDNREVLGIAGKSGLGKLNEAGERQIDFCQDNTLRTQGGETMGLQLVRKLMHSKCSVGEEYYEILRQIKELINQYSKR